MVGWGGAGRGALGGTASAHPEQSCRCPDFSRSLFVVVVVAVVVGVVSVVVVAKGSSSKKIIVRTLPHADGGLVCVVRG